MKRLGLISLTVLMLLPLAAIAAADTWGPFSDDDGSVHEPDINGLASSGITRGCNPPDNDRFCPDAPVSRGEMAAFLVRGLEIPDSDVDHFVDDAASEFAYAIDALAAAEVMKGCNPPQNDRICPDHSVTRGEMAAFLTRALQLPPPGEDSPVFTDTVNHVFASDIAALASADITRGCNPPENTRFCPDQAVTRGEMSSFLVRALPDVNARPNRLTLRDHITCDDSSVECSGSASAAVGTHFMIREGWYQAIPYRDREEARFFSPSTNVMVTHNGTELDQIEMNPITRERVIERLWQSNLAPMEPGTHTFRLVWRWDGVVRQIVNFTLVVD